jgi:hypothetical protein
MLKNAWSVLLISVLLHANIVWWQSQESEVEANFFFWNTSNTINSICIAICMLETAQKGLNLYKSCFSWIMYCNWIIYYEQGMSHWNPTHTMNKISLLKTNIWVIQLYLTFHWCWIVNFNYCLGQMGFKFVVLLNVFTPGWCTEAISMLRIKGLYNVARPALNG